MKNVFSLICAAGLLAALAGTASAHPGHQGIDRRQARQEVRIRHGLRSGEITRAEAYRLRMVQRHIARLERRAYADGRMGLRERARIHRQLNRESRMIRRFAHNRRSI